ncbi:MAG TPA: septum formation initiator family protein [Polyangia bacterium]
MRRNSKKQWLLRGGSAALLALTFGYGPYHLYNRSGFSRYLDLRRELAMIRHENALLELEIGRLERESHALRFDARSIERETRTHTKWVKPGEVVFDLGEEPSQ